MNADWLIEYLTDNMPWVLKMIQTIKNPTKEIMAIEFIAVFVAIGIVVKIIISWVKSLFQ